MVRQVVKKIIILSKKEGDTPLFALENFRKNNPKYLKVPMTYAGRLDPMASGVLVVLAGDEIKNKDKYLSLDKEYNFSVLFGFSTDTYDILGKVCKSEFPNLSKKELIKNIENNLKYFKGKIKQKYPIYSSKTVNGKPLFSYARNKEDVEVPEREIFVKKLSLIKVRKINNEKLFLDIKKRITRVKGDFRQKQILKLWQASLKKSQSYYIADFKISCGSGTYVRAISHSLGEKIKIPALAFSIKRTKIDKFRA
jgi:tRNA pseudouridine55 synthase